MSSLLPLAVGSVSLLLSLVLVFLFASKRGGLLSGRGRLKTGVLSLFGAGLLAWPPLWLAAIQSSSSFSPSTSSSYPSSSPFLPVSLVLPILVLLFDLYSSLSYFEERTQTAGEGGDTAPWSSHASFPSRLHSGEAIGLLGMAFAMFAYFKSDHPTGRRLIVISAICSIAVCIPAFHVDPVTDEARLIETAKKVCLSYSLGGILGGAILLASDDKE